MSLETREDVFYDDIRDALRWACEALGCAESMALTAKGRKQSVEKSLAYLDRLTERRGPPGEPFVPEEEEEEEAVPDAF